MSLAGISGPVSSIVRYDVPLRPNRRWTPCAQGEEIKVNVGATKAGSSDDWILSMRYPSVGYIRVVLVHLLPKGH
eukprot:8943621-Karenia_brevis.AAC.1